MRICIEGWSKINHSYSISCINKLLEFVKLPIDLRFKEISYANNSWNYSNNFNGFSDKNIKKIFSIDSPKSNELFDIIYRLSYPFNFKKGNSKKLYVFATSEFQNINNMFINEIPANFSKRDDLKIITPSKWSKIGFIESGFNTKQVEIVPLGVDCDIFYPISSERKNDIRKKLKLKKEDFIISNVGGMSSNKGIDYLIVAFAVLKKKYKNLKLILKDQSNLYGTTGKDVFLKTKKGRNGHLLDDNVENDITFISKNVTISLLNDLYNVSDCYVSPYRAEGFNLCPLEAAATGTPIIVTEGGSTDDYFKKDFGLQIKSEFINSNNRKYLDPNLESLIENISLIVQNPGKYGNKKSIKFIEDNYSWKKIVEKIYIIFNKNL
tara:strand:- start:480 stop:1619 length:1140 start_codon:yes stop_codon:yes gene_type:complete